MKRQTIAAVLVALLSLSAAMRPAVAAPTAFRISFPLNFGGHGSREPAPLATTAEIRAEKRLRLARYGFQIADAIISAIGYRAYAKCLSCLAYPGGGPLGSASVSVANFSGNRAAEADPLIQPFSNGGFLSLALGAMAYDFVDAHIEKRWSTERRATADLVEIGAHVWGIATWLPELKTIHRDTTAAAACGAQWQAKNYGAAFSDGCVNQFYRPGSTNVPAAPGVPVVVVCAPPQFKPGAYLFATPGDYVVASGSPCAGVRSPFP
jgi:hypothetical protein